MAKTKQEKATVLIVDDDQVTLRYLDVSLSRSGRYNVEVADSVASAMDILSHEIVDVIISDIEMPGSDGFWFLRHVKGRPRWANIPMLFLTSDSTRDTRITALSRGICYYITKPSTISEIIVYIEAALRRESSVRNRLARRNYSLAGDFATVPFTDLIGLLTMGHRSGRLAVLTPRAGGQLLLIKGMIHHATFANLEGEEAIYRIIQEQNTGQFEFQPEEIDPAVTPNTIAVSPTAILMEGARRDDMARMRRGSGKANSSAEIVEEESGGCAVETCELMVGPERTVVNKEVYSSGVGDPFGLGELLLQRNPEIEEWTQEAVKGERMLVLLITDVSAGVYALAAMGSPLSEQQIDIALSSVRKTLQLTFQFRDDHTLDVLLVDQNHPALVQKYVKQRPSILIVAPRSGDWLTLSVQSQVELAELVGHLDPELVFGIGNPSTPDGLRDVLAKSSCAAELSCVLGAIDHPSEDFRDRLLAAIDVWNQAK